MCRIFLILRVCWLYDTIQNYCRSYHLGKACLCVCLKKPTNESFGKKLESVQYNAALATNKAIKGITQEKQEN